MGQVDGSPVVKIDLTRPQIDALLGAAVAMLAGEEAEGDAVGVSFAVLNRAVDKLADAIGPTPSLGVGHVLVEGHDPATCPTCNTQADQGRNTQ
jgi:hypothetical protein